MEKNLTAYMFARSVNNEAINLLEKAGKFSAFTYCSGEHLYNADIKLNEMEEYEREHRTLAMAYIVEYDGKNIYENLVSDFNPEWLVSVGLIHETDLKDAKEFKRQMLRLSAKVKRFDAAL